MAFQEKKFYAVIGSLLKGQSASEISKEIEGGVSRKTVTNYVNKLIDPNDAYYNPEVYDSILFIREAKYGQFLDKDLLDEMIQMFLNGYNLKEVSEDLMISESTVHNYLNSLKEEASPYYDESLFQRIQKVREKYQMVYQSLGGATSQRGRVRTEDEIRELAKHLIATGDTLVQASVKLDIPPSTLYDNVMSVESVILKEAIQEVFDENRKK